MTEKEAVQALRLEGGIEISGNARRITRFFEGLDTAIQALEEIQQYREIGTVEECRACKIGTRVYEIYRFCGEGAWEIEEHKIKFEDLDKIGKTIFLTEEAAKERLKELEG